MEEVFKSSTKATVNKDSSNQSNTETILQTHMKFPLNTPIITNNLSEHTAIIFQRCDILSSYIQSLPTKQDDNIYSDHINNIGHFPITKMIVKMQRSKEKGNDELCFPIKTNLATSRCTTVLKNSVVSLPRVMQSGNFFDEDYYGEILVGTYNETETKQRKIVCMKNQQEKPTYRYIHYINDDVLAAQAAKNISYLRQPKNGDEPPHIFIQRIQYSRSPLRIQCSSKNMNDLKKRRRHQRHVGKTVKRTNIKMKLIKMSYPRRVSQIRARKIEKIYDFVFNTERISFNKLSNIYHKGQQEPWPTHFIHSEVRDLSSQEDLIVDDSVSCVASKTRIRVEYFLPFIENLAIANVAPSTPVSSNCRLTASASSVPPSKTIFILTKNNEHERSVDKYFFSAINSDVSNVIYIKSGEEKASTELQRSLKTNVFNGSLSVAKKKTEEKEEDNISVTSYKSDDISNSCFDEWSFNEVKLEMNGTNIVSNTMTPSLNERIQSKNGSSQVALADGSGVLCAAADISKLANFGKKRRELVTLPISCSKVSNDGKNSVLPTRTLLRRQRSLKVQNCADKQEDPIERLNRLRARISGALSEVKGVLKHYSIEESIENEEIPADSFSNINLTNNSQESRIEPKQITSSLDTIKDEGPVSFRFVRKVRRQSVFSESDVKEEKNKTEVGKDTNDGEDYGVNNSCKPSLNTNDGEDSIKKNYIDKVSLIHSDSKTKNLNNVNENICSDFECQPLKTESKSTELQNKSNIEEVKKEKEVGKITNYGENNSCIPLLKNSIKENCVEKVSLIHPYYKTKNIDQLNENIVSDFGTQFPQSVNSAPQITDRRDKLNLHCKDSEHVYLGTLEKETIPHETPTNSNIRRSDSNDLYLSVKEVTSKKKDSSRRASIAAVEGSQIYSAINTVIPLAIKIQRRPSDSETIIKRKVKTSEAANSSSAKKIVKVKRAPVKNKLDVITHQLTTSNLENNQCIISAKETTSNNTTFSAETTKELSRIDVPNTSGILSTQLAIVIEVNDAPSNSAQEPDDIKSEVTQLLSIATNNSRSPTKIFDANSVMVAALASPLQAGEPSSHTNNSDTQPTNVFVDKENIVKEQKISQNKEIIETKLSKPTDSQRDLNVKQNFEGVENSQLLECIVNDTTQLTAKSINTDVVFNDLKSFEQQKTVKTTQNYLPQLIDEKQIYKKMPELQVSPTPVKPVQAFAESSADKINISKKETVVRRIARKVSEDKSFEKTKADESQLHEIVAVGKENERLIIDNQQKSCVASETFQNPDGEKESSPGASAIPAPLEKIRKVKKKVIIKRQHRKLSTGENSFFKEAEVVPGATETLEKAIAYVTDDEEDVRAQNADAVKPIKSCIKSREFQVGDWVMYGERFRKTQIRWKKGQISERITSISYKIKIDDKEVSAHISYIKKYTDRKVNFGGKEYLEIDYEQLAEEERQARSYSIWNMV